MPSLLRRHECPACGQFHAFVLHAGSIAAGTEYAYVCPRERRTKIILAAATGAAVEYPPPGAVPLTRVPAPQGSAPEFAVSSPAGV